MAMPAIAPPLIPELKELGVEVAVDSGGFSSPGLS
jgi:hypothetical protein